MRKKGLFILMFTFIFIFITAYISIKPLFNYISGFLSKSEQVKANILVVEGWLTYDDLKTAYQNFSEKGYEYIVTTGLRWSSEYYTLSENGYLVFYTKNNNSYNVESRQHVIEADAFSGLSGEHSAHFNLYVNDSLIGEFLAHKHKGKYSAKWEGSLSKIDSIMVQFTNDAVGSYGDRNLFVKEIIIDHKTRIPYQNNSIYDIGLLDGKRRIINKFNSNAELARNCLLSMGIDSSLVIATSGKRVKLNRTLSSTLAFRDWVKSTDIDIRGINIISRGTHARRTWMTYNKVLNETYDIGIISLPDYKEPHSRKYKALRTIRESIGIIYYWFILLPY